MKFDAEYRTQKQKETLSNGMQDKFFKQVSDKNSALIAELIQRKSGHYDNLIKGNIEILPGVRNFIEMIAGKYRIAIGSGAMKGEIEDILEFAGIRGLFEIIVCADDIENCKPAPDVYLEVLRRLNESSSASENISAYECLVIEDSVSGIKAALAAGMKCLAVTNSYSADELSSAHMVRESLSSVGTEDLSALF